MKKSFLISSFLVSILFFAGCTSTTNISEETPVAEVPIEVQEMIKEEKKNPTQNIAYTAPTVEEFYKDMGETIKEVSPKATAMSNEDLSVFLKKELISHEPHLI